MLTKTEQYSLQIREFPHLATTQDIRAGVTTITYYPSRFGRPAYFRLHTFASKPYIHEVTGEIFADLEKCEYGAIAMGLADRGIYPRGQKKLIGDVASVVVCTETIVALHDFFACGGAYGEAQALRDKLPEHFCVSVEN